MPLSYRELTQPAAEPVTLAMAKQQLVIDNTFTADDTLITLYIVAARQYCERVMQRYIFTRSMLMTLDYFPLLSECVSGADQYAYVSSYIRSLSIIVPKAGLASVQSIKYTGNDGTPVTLPASTYVVDTVSEPGRIMPAPGCVWPYQQNYIPGQVQITYTMGTYGDGVNADNCPTDIKLAILLLVSHFYAHREATTEASLTNIPLGVDSLLAPHTFDTVY
ncbi:MAG: head-tail connector protein [Acidobacteriaceae bacterium]|nr:head-tail connector protein [Acidobacteriaceae bacterium]